jgi:hypothetical protein
MESAQFPWGKDNGLIGYYVFRFVQMLGFDAANTRMLGFSFLFLQNLVSLQ